VSLPQIEADLASLGCLGEMNLGLIRGEGGGLNPVLESEPEHCCLLIPAATP
jgi:hypothetical protein